MASLQSFLAEAKDIVGKKKRPKYSISEKSKNKEATMSSSMFLMCDFGVTKQANKLKKKAWELLEAGNPKTISLHSRKKKNAGLKELRRSRQFDSGDQDRFFVNSNTRDYTERKYKSGEYNLERGKRIKEKLPDNKNYYDIRKTDDYGASRTGYLGFQKDPYKGYGGMMEEEVPVIPTGKNIRVKPRLTYLSPTITSDFGFVLPKKYNADKIRSSIALNRDGLKYIRKTEKQMFGLRPEVRDPRKLIRLAGVRSNLAQQIKNKERILGKR